MSQYHAIGILSPVASPRQRESDYYYTIAFPNTRAALGSPESCAQQNQSERVSYADAVALLQLVTPGGKEREQQAVLEFRHAWVHKFRCMPPEDSDTIPFVLFQELMREVIVQRFDALPELFVKTSVSRDEKAPLLLSFRPSRVLLADMADRMQISVAVMPEIHPDSQCWATGEPKRSEREHEQWTKPEAQEELYRLFLAGKIPTEEATLFDADHDREDQRMWSRRIHALQRFSDPDVAKAVERNSQAPTMYLPFRQRASLRYLYRQIDSAGTMADVTPFRVVDKIRLTKAIIDAQFDCSALVQRNVLLHHCCTHTHHTDTIDTSIDVLRVQWGSLLGPWRLYRQGLTSISQLLHYQPIVHVRNYFGEEIALYFAFVSFQTRALQLLSGLALLLLFAASWASLPRSYQTLAFCLLNCLFIRVFVRKWELTERQLAAEWGVTTLEASLDARPQFRGELKRCYITHHVEPHYPPSKRLAKRMVTTIALSALTMGFLAINYLLVTSNAWVAFYERSAFNVQVGNVLLTLLTRCMGTPLARLSTWTNDWENYKTQDDYDANLTLKYALMQSANSFSILVFMTLIRPFLSQDVCNASELHMSCQDQAVGLLTAILFVDLALALWDLRSPLYGLLCAGRCRKLFRKRSPTQRSQSMAQYLLVKSQETDKGNNNDDPDGDGDGGIEDELELDEYEGVMFDYAQVMLNLGFVVGFAAVQPLMVFLAWAVAVLQIRIDTYKLCHLTQRPFPRQKNSIGSWIVYLRALSLGSLLLNASMATMIWLQELTTRTSVSSISTLHDLLLTEIRASSKLQLASPEDASLVWQTETHALVIFVAFGLIWWIAGLTSNADRVVLKRLHLAQQTHTFLADKYLRNLDTISDELKNALPMGRVFLNGVHRYIVTGDKAEEDAADELFEELKTLQLCALEKERQIKELRTIKAPVGILAVKILGINILPIMDLLTKSVDAFVQLTLKRHGAAPYPNAKDPVPQNTPVKKSRSPQWNETHEFKLDALDFTLSLTVFDKELLAQNRQIGCTSIALSDIVTRTSHEQQISPGSSPLRRQSITFLAPVATVNDSSKPEKSQKIEMTIASYELPLEMREGQLTGMQSDLLKHGHPRLSLQCGVKLQELGELLWEQQKLQAKIKALQAHEAQMFAWKTSNSVA